MDGWWECDEIDEMICRFAKARLKEEVAKNRKALFYAIKARLEGFGSKTRIKEVASHYNIGNDLFELMLDKRMVYSCAYWKNAKDLDHAQEDKLELCCRKLDLKPGMRILDIGVGWGSFAKYAAEKYGVEVVGITVSEEQVKFASEYCKGLPIEIRLQDYRSLNERFDQILSLGMFEHVTPRFHRKYMEIVNRCLKPGGIFLLQTIVRNKAVNRPDPWIAKYIYPNSLIPTLKQIFDSSEGLFVVEDCHNFGTDYDKTLNAWYKNFLVNWEKIKDKYGERFFRMWKFYLLFCAGVFRARYLNLWQFVFSNNGIPEGFQKKIDYNFS